MFADEKPSRPAWSMKLFQLSRRASGVSSYYGRIKDCNLQKAGASVALAIVTFKREEAIDRKN